MAGLLSLGSENPDLEVPMVYSWYYHGVMGPGGTVRARASVAGESLTSWAAGPGCGFCGGVACLSRTSEAGLSSDQKLRFLTSQAPDEW